MIVRIYLFVILLIGLVKNSSQSDCVVSQWGLWSQCHGGCSNGLIVRNRDVVKPPLPELNAEGKLMQRLCPHLYETKYCDRNTCPYQNVDYRTTAVKPVKNDFADSARSLVEKQMRKMGLGIENDTMQHELKNKFISETEQLFKLDEVLSKKMPNLNGVPNSQIPPIDISSRQISNRQWKNEMMGVTSRNAPQWNPTSVVRQLSTPPSLELMRKIDLNKNIQVSSTPNFVSGLRNTISSTKSKHSGDYSINSLLQKIEHALDSNQPLDERYIKRALRRNRKMSKIIVDAYRQRQNSNITSEITTKIPILKITTTTPSTTLEDNINLTTQEALPTTTKTTTIPSTIVSYTEELGTTTNAPMLFWPKHGYVPNTRKHASEITSQLYMTNDITQTLSDETEIAEINPNCPLSKRCCKIERTDCSDGTEPTTVKRWYRPPGSTQCIAYHYPRCSNTQEMEELPILFEQNCQDLCFAKNEKRISPLFYLESEDS